ncbi:hypothetical protein KFF05_03955 [bacterium SCSIO 12827]|nr:hypothetical protein KFF05_03955 [bacterium SCSIO 12827]
MATESRTCAILYGDIVGSSAIKGDMLKTQVASIVKMLAKQASSIDGILYANTWGDGIVVVGNTPAIIAEEALRFRDRFRNEDWENEGFPSPVHIRIGLDMNSVVLEIEGGLVTGVSGQGMVPAARIEQIVEANRIWCSPSFKHTLSGMGGSNIRFVSTGLQELPKGAGSMELFDLSRADDPPPDSARPATAGPTGKAPRVPKIKGRITDRDRDDFLRDAFVTVKRYFETAANSVSNQYPEVAATIQTIHSLKFTCDVYVNGESKNRCKIWLSQGSYSEGIGYAEGSFSIDADNSYNETIRVEDDGHELFLNPLGMRMYGNHDKRFSPEEAAEFLWEMFIERLEH